MGREAREANDLGAEDVAALGVDRGLGEPDPRGVAPEATAEIGDAPPHFGHLLPPRRERQDHVVIRHGDRIAVTAMAPTAPTIGLEHGRIRGGSFTLEPFEQRRPEIEADLGEGVHRPRDPTIGPVHARPDDGAITLLLDALVPVVKRRGRRLDGDLVEPGIFPWRLVEMSVNDDRADVQASSTSATLARTSGNRSSPRARASTRRSKIG